MANVLHKTTKQFISSVNTPDYLDGQWIINPNMSEIENFPQKYWIIEDTIVRLASESERVQIDTLEEFQGLSIESVKEKLNTDINVFRDAYIDSGVEFMGHVFDSDQRARENISGMCNALALGVPIPATFTWRSKNNEDVPMDAQSLGDFGIGVLTFVSTCFGVSWAHKDYLKQLETTDIAALLSYDYTIGWPTKSIANLILSR